MIVLAMDTCLAACSAAVLRDGETLAWASEPMTRGHQERLAAMVGEVMARAGLAFADLDRVGVTIGPGSFTGLRVGLAFAKGLALALDRPCVGVGTLEALAASLAVRGPVAAVVDAGRGRVYLQFFDDAVAVSGPDSVDSNIAASRLVEVYPSGRVTLTGPGAGLLAGVLPGADVAVTAVPDPVAVAQLAVLAARIAPRPLYLRAPDAKVKSR